MTQADTSQRWAKLAKLPCRACNGTGCPDCGGTGLAAWELLRECSQCMGKHDGCTLLQGGLLLAACIRVLERQGAEVMIGYGTSEKGWYVALEWVDWPGSKVLKLQESDYYGELEMALLEALEAVLLPGAGRRSKP